MAQKAPTVSQYIDGLVFPARKEQVYNHLIFRKAPQPLIDRIKKLPNRLFQSKGDLWIALEHYPT
jgi:hypothetical protein